jgi:RNA polymerase sigma factor (sigma-70 family)
MGTPHRPGHGSTDAELIRACRKDPAAFEVLVQRHAVLLDRWLLAQTGDAAIAHDLMAETFAQAWGAARRFRGAEEGSGAAWIYGIARNLLRQHLRKGRLETSARRRLGIATVASHDSADEEITSRIDARELAPAVREAFAELTPEQQHAIKYRVIDELSYEEVAARIGCSPVTARSRVFRGLRTLRASVNRGASS